MATQACVTTVHYCLALPVPEKAYGVQENTNMHFK